MMRIPEWRDAGLAVHQAVAPRAAEVRYVWNALWRMVGDRLFGRATGDRRAWLSRSGRRSANRLALGLCSNAEKWDALVEAQPRATVFHTMAWLQFVARRRAAELRPFVVLDRGECVGVFPVFVIRRGWFRLATSPPPQAATPYLGPLVPDGLLSATVEAATERLRGERVSYLDMRFAVQVASSALIAQRFQTETRATFLLDLRGGPDQLWSRLRSSCRRAIRKARNSGVSVVEGNLAANLDRYNELATQVFAKSRRSPPLDREDYESLAALARDGGPVKVFFAYHQDRLIAGGIFPYDARTVYYLDGASDAAEHAVRPNNLLHWEVIRWACANGLVNYDMVGAGIEGVARFKRGFGPLEVPYTYAFRSLDFLTGAARSAYAILAPTGRAAEHAVQRLSGGVPPRLPGRAVRND